MLNVSRVPFSAPGIYRAPETPLLALTGVRMDICGFAGVAPRGPVRQPIVDEHWPDTRPCVEVERPQHRSVAIAVESFDEYQHLFGGFEGPGLLPYAVAAFFEQGGRRAWITRIVHSYNDATDALGVAAGKLLGVSPTSSTGTTLRARNEGTWGNAIHTAIALNATPVGFYAAALDHVTLISAAEITAGSLLRVTLSDGSRVFRFVELIETNEDTLQPRRLYRAYFDAVVTLLPISLEVIEANVDIDDGDGRRERFERIGLHHAHPRWLAQVLCWQSQLVWPDVSWSNDWLVPDSIELVTPALNKEEKQFVDGEDRYADILPSDVINISFLPDDEPGEGVNSFAAVTELATLCIPDLYSPAPLPDYESIVDVVSVAGPTFERCVDLPAAAPEQDPALYDLSGLRLDPTLPGDLNAIIELQQTVVAWAESLRNIVVLLDVPPGLNQRKILEWRTNFDSSYAAAYYPWLTVARRDDSRDKLIRVPPSAVAAGIIARTEITFGLPHGPANAIAYEVVTVDDQVSPRRHDELHPQGINIYLQEREGMRLTAARTLSRDPQWRQLSVRRLMIMLRRVLERQMHWAVFETNGPRLRLKLSQLLQTFLRRLFKAGAFKGATEAEAFFVNCDAVLNPRVVMDAGQLIAEIGVAPSEPIEFIVLRLLHDGDGTLTVRE